MERRFGLPSLLLNSSQSPPKSSTIHIADFEDGDVEIRLSEDSSCVRRLHKFILTRHSPYFKASLSEAWSSPSEKLIYVLEPDEEGETWMLVRQVLIAYLFHETQSQYLESHLTCRFVNS